MSFFCITASAARNTPSTATSSGSGGIPRPAAPGRRWVSHSPMDRSDVLSADELGGAITLLPAPEVKRDADADVDADEADADAEGSSVEGWARRSRREARKKRDDVVMGWGVREGTLIGWGWKVDGRKCGGERKRDDRKMRQARTWEGTEAVHRSEAVARSTPNRNTISAH
ncbi:hypothetical protein B0H13DRAFT_1923436 [Mycena leptocephala]|nr:hypothetical protein B0H13DRAFT_1923436 [Mycena leptocephala]